MPSTSTRHTSASTQVPSTHALSLYSHQRSFVCEANLDLSQSQQGTQLACLSVCTTNKCSPVLPTPLYVRTCSVACVYGVQNLPSVCFHSKCRTGLCAVQTCMTDKHRHVYLGCCRRLSKCVPFLIRTAMPGRLCARRADDVRFVSGTVVRECTMKAR